MFIQNKKSVNNFRGNRNEIITLVNNLKNENNDLKNNNELLNKNTLLLTENNNLLIKNLNNNEIIAQYKEIIEKLKYEIITLKNMYNTNPLSYLDSDDE